MKSTSNCLWQFPFAAKAASRRSTKFHAEKSTSNCLWQFPFAAKAALWRSTKFHIVECPKVGHSLHRFVLLK